MTRISAVLFDLDGVIRLFDPEDTSAIEHRHGLPSGAIQSIAFSPALLAQVTTGRITRAEWLQRIGTELGDQDAAQAWGSVPSRLSRPVLDLVDELRGHGIRTAILTNGTDTIMREAEEAGLHRHFDAVFNSAEIGWTKPDVRAFQYALDALRLGPDEVFFTDDSASKLEGARSLGMPTHHFSGADGLRSALRAVGALD